MISTNIETAIKLRAFWNEFYDAAQNSQRVESSLFSCAGSDSGSAFTTREKEGLKRTLTELDSAAAEAEAEAEAGVLEALVFHYDHNKNFSNFEAQPKSDVADLFRGIPYSSDVASFNRELVALLRMSGSTTDQTWSSLSQGLADPAIALGSPNTRADDFTVVDLLEMAEEGNTAALSAFRYCEGDILKVFDSRRDNSLQSTVLEQADGIYNLVRRTLVLIDQVPQSDTLQVQLSADHVRDLATRLLAIDFSKRGQTVMQDQVAALQATAAWLANHQKGQELRYLESFAARLTTPNADAKRAVISQCAAPFQHQPYQAGTMSKTFNHEPPISTEAGF